MPIDKDLDSLLRCRERRRRRIEMRRRLSSVCAVAGTGADNWQSQKLNLADAENENSVIASCSMIDEQQEVMTSPVYGSMSVVGRAREMEDEISVRLNLCRPEINGFKPVHYFGVFDGHGGHHVSNTSLFYSKLTNCYFQWEVYKFFVHYTKGIISHLLKILVVHVNF